MDALEQGAVFKDDVDKDSLIVPPLQARRQKLARSQVRLRQFVCSEVVEGKHWLSFEAV